MALAQASINKRYSLAGIEFVYPPSDVSVNDSYRVSVKQTAAGQFADKAGIGGCEITISGKVAVRLNKSLWLQQIRKALLESSVKAEYILFYDAMDNITYDVIVKQQSFTFSDSVQGFNSYRIVLQGQVMGQAWQFDESLKVASLYDITVYDQGILDSLKADANEVAGFAGGAK